MLKTASLPFLRDSVSAVHHHTYAKGFKDNVIREAGAKPVVPVNLLISTKMAGSLFTALTGVPHPAKNRLRSVAPVQL